MQSIIPKPTDGLRLRHAFAIGAVSVTALVGATSPASAAQQVSAQTAGTDVTAADEPGGTSIVPKADTVVQATITPSDCDTALNDTEKDCRLGVEVPADDSPQQVTQVVKGDAKSVVVTSETAAEPSISPLSTPTIYHWPSTTAKLCSVSCSIPHAWESRMTSDAYAASDGYAWGDINRYGYAAEHVRVGQTGFGFSVVNHNAGFRNQPSCLRLYANNEPQVYASFKGAPLSTSYYMHKHYTECDSDGVTHKRRTWLTTGRS